MGFIAIKKSFAECLNEVQAYMAENYSVLLSKSDLSEKKAEVKNYIEKALKDRKLSCVDMGQEELIENLYREMVEYSFLTSYLYNKEVEEININRWNDVKVNYSDGSVRPVKERFRSPEHALDVIRKLIRSSGAVLDASQPMIKAHLQVYGNIRITAYAPPVIDSSAGVVASIRIVNPKKMKREDFIAFGTITEEIYDFLRMCSLAKISQVYAGETNSGKTTLMTSVLEDVLEAEPSLRCITVEEQTREINLVKTDEKGNVRNNVVHLVTRKDNDEKRNITQEDLLVMALTTNPDVISVAEMKSEEAFAAQEAARTGHLVLTTTHSKSAIGTFPRMVTLCRMKYDIDFQMLYELVTEAFTLVIFMRKFQNSSKRRIIEIGEMEILDDGKSKYHTLWKYRAKTDSFEKINPISLFLRERLRDGFIPEEEIARY